MHLKSVHPLHCTYLPIDGHVRSTVVSFATLVDMLLRICNIAKSDGITPVLYVVVFMCFLVVLSGNQA